jgi:hypothetical protein
MKGTVFFGMTQCSLVGRYGATSPKTALFIVKIILKDFFNKLFPCVFRQEPRFQRSKNLPSDSRNKLQFEKKVSI